jgi:ABC-type transport system substrate-binding protein
MAKEITVAFDGSPLTLDPLYYKQVIGHFIIKNIFDTLVSTNEYDEIIPRLAKRWDIVDHKIYRFYLRDDVYFHNGRKLTAHDYINCINRNFTEYLDSQDMDVLTFVEGYDEAVKAKKSIKGIKALNDYTLEIILKKPHVEFIYNLSSYLFVYPIEEVKNQKRSFSKYPIGSGPYKISTNENSGKRIILEAFDRYYGEKPIIDKIIFEYVPPKNIISKFMSNEIDIISYFYNSGNIINELKKLPKDKYNIIEHEGLRSLFITFNTNRKPFNDKAIRKYINSRIDRKTLANFIPNLTPSYQLFGKNVLGRISDERPQEYAAIKLTKDKLQLIKNKTFKMYMYKEYAPYFEKVFNKENEFKIKPIIFTDIKSVINILHKTRDFDLFLTSWNVNRPSGITYSTLLYSKGKYNGGQYKSNKMDELFEKAFEEEDEYKRKIYCEQISKFIQDDSPIIPLGFLGTSGKKIIKPYIIVKNPNIFRDFIDFERNQVDIDINHYKKFTGKN